jgi:hypothetical protein
MPAPVLAAPLVIPFAEAIGVSIAALGMAKATDKVNEFIQENPEQSIKIFQMIMPSQGIANALKNKSSEGDEEVSEDMDVEVEEKPKLTGKEKSEKIKAAIRRARAGKGNYSSPDAEGSAVDIRGSVIREAEDMGLADKDLKDKPYKEKGYDFRDYIPRGAYKKKYADGGAIGIEVLFGPKRDNFRYGGDTMGGKNDKSKSSPGPDSSKVSAQQQSNHEQAMAAAQNDGPSFKDKVKSVITNPATQALGGAILTGGINLAIPGALDKLNKARVIKNAIDYARYVAPNEAIEGELENIQTQGGIVPYADGGRVGLFMGGSPLTGQALAIYNSMNAYGFDDQAIADALSAQGLYTLPGSSTPETTTPNIINQQLQTGGGGDNNFGGQGIGKFGNLDPNTLETMQVEVADGMGGTKIVEKQTALTAGGLRRTLDNKNPVNAGIDVKPMAITIMEALMGKKNDSEFDPEGKIYGTFNNPNYKDLSFFGKIKEDYSRQKELKQLQKEFELQEKLKKQIAKEEADRAAQYGATNYGQGVGGQSYSGDAIGAGNLGFGIGATTGGPVSNRTGGGRQDYSKGGLATMFKEKR